MNACCQGAILERWNSLSDEQVVADVLDGQTALFEVLMRRYNERMYRAARAIVRDDAEAEDIMQQVYVNAYANLRQFKGQAQFSTWLTKIAINEALLRVRRNKRYSPFGEEDSECGAAEPQSPRDPERQAASGELRALLESGDRPPSRRCARGVRAAGGRRHEHARGRAGARCV